jgi:hypothetical protein
LELILRLKLGGELAIKSAKLTCEVKRLEKKLAEKREMETCSPNEIIQKLTQELKNTKNTLKTKEIEIRMLKDQYSDE